MIGMKRRTFVRKTAMAAAALPFAGAQDSKLPFEVDIHAPRSKRSPMGMPGLFPARVIEVRDERAIVESRISEEVVRHMVERGMRELTGASTAKEAWVRFFEPRDVVAIKVNPSGVPGTTTQLELLREVIRGIQSAGVENRNIVVYDRFSRQLEEAGYPAAVPAGVRVLGFDNRYLVGSAAYGYDMSVYCDMSCFGERETRSYLASIVSRHATKIVNLPVLKEHNASGVTGCLKNIAYGSFNNVARTHVPPKSYTDPIIPLLCSIEPLRSKAVLHIMDGLRAVWHGGPFARRPEFIWEAKSLLFGTDPVAIDRIELEIVEAKRKEKGAPSLWDRDAAHLGSQSEMQQTAQKNPFYREPGHIRTAAEMGLGTWNLARIQHRIVAAS
jgi:uncharacterized protein (DUF362 family)